MAEWRKWQSWRKTTRRHSGSGYAASSHPSSKTLRKMRNLRKMRIFSSSARSSHSPLVCLMSMESTATASSSLTCSSSSLLRRQPERDDSPSAASWSNLSKSSSGFCTKKTWRSSTSRKLRTSGTRRRTPTSSHPSSHGQRCLSSRPTPVRRWSIRYSPRTRAEDSCSRPRATRWPMCFLRTMATTRTDSGRRFIMSRYRTCEGRTTST